MSPDGVVVRRPSPGRTFFTFLFGLVVGAVLVVAAVALGILDREDTEALPLPVGETPDDAATASPTPSADPTASGSGDVPPSCLAAAEYNATVSTALDGVAVGVRDQDAAAVEEGLDAIADIKPDMDAASAECRALAGEDGAGDDGDDSGDDTGGDESGSTQEPSATPTP